MKCKICKKENSTIFSAKILNKYDVEYFHCKNCGFLQTQEPFWLSEAYTNSINNSDTGYMQRNINLCKQITIFLLLFFDKNAKYLDYAGGYGVFVRLMRDVGFDFYWSDKFSQNLFANGFEYDKNEKYMAITSFESFEHFENPIKEIEDLLKMSKNIIFTTDLLPNPVPLPKAWWYFGLNHGQHISFYDKTTLSFIAKKYNLYYSNLGNLHFFTEKKINNFLLKFLKLYKIGFYKILQQRLNSKTWEDYLLMDKK